VWSCLPCSLSRSLSLPFTTHPFVQYSSRRVYLLGDASMELLLLLLPMLAGLGQQQQQIQQTQPNGYFFVKKKPNPSSHFLLEPSSSICTCKLIFSLSVYLCVYLSQLSPWSLQTDNGIWGKRSLMHCVCVCVSLCLSGFLPH